MITDDQVVALFAKANPVPSLDLLDPIEPVSPGHPEDRSERSSKMSEVQTIQPTPQNRPGWTPALMLAGIAVVALLGVVLVARNNTAEVADTPITIAKAFLEARNDHDAEAMMALLSPDVVFEDALIDTVEDVPSVVELERITGGVYDLGTCAEEGRAGVPVRCPYRLENEITRVLGLVPGEGSAFEFMISDGLIVLVNNQEVGEPHGQAVLFSEVVPWVESTNPEDALTIDSDATSPEALELWEEYVPAFVEAHGG
ncbi:MAG: hypothetical protein ACRDXF_05880 [Acidimicrobiia bacterium]